MGGWMGGGMGGGRGRGFSSLMKQNKKGRNYAVFYFTGKRFFFYIYAVIVKQFFFNAPLITTQVYQNNKSTQVLAWDLLTAILEVLGVTVYNALVQYVVSWLCCRELLLASLLLIVNKTPLSPPPL